MDYQNRVGSKFGGGGVAGASEAAVDRRERLRKLALETIDLAKDPYILRNHLGGLECRLCLTLHTNEGSYLAHTQGKKHQTNLARRAAREAQHDRSDGYAQQLAQQQAAKNQVQHKTFIKIGSPGYQVRSLRVYCEQRIQRANRVLAEPTPQVTKVRDPITGQLGLLFQVHYPQIAENVKPFHRFMSAFEQHVEQPDRQFQYLLIAAEPYQTIAFKIQSKEIDLTEGMSWEHWDPDSKTLSFQFLFSAQSA
ncbi:BZ3500_MvSof-1268-A1-R1_Chr7-1g09167 [Microbotryum saponariae]|uniref:BZ3500_MvSof-1268-A1-R1_Chr7-1g09167 protein n=1 Tax=Microbotryum saponariae TaxID=289078 RepID=A0A2X0LUK3_9BASI|nr:BZ3501_MvSof-1269-A2-R1_Chr7-1g08872 [Microbotryum saponariae]SDA02923.1 BZ3500_MvSof-1268-A1-R1_Chr7-1g09167 [Microbotryum saponariae]